MPPVLAFQSIVDTTVSTPAVIHDLFDHLPPGRSELVLFDLNRQAGIDAFTRPEAVLPRLIGEAAATFTRHARDQHQRRTRWRCRRCRWRPARMPITTEPLGLSWPESIYSLSHVALPFPIDDPIYGGEGHGRELGSVSLGRLSPRGEKGVADRAGGGPDAADLEPVLSVPRSTRRALGDGRAAKVKFRGHDNQTLGGHGRGDRRSCWLSRRAILRRRSPLDFARGDPEPVEGSGQAGRRAFDRHGRVADLRRRPGQLEVLAARSDHRRELRVAARSPGA